MSIIRADSIKNRVGDGAPDFPNGITVTGLVTATTLNQNVTGIVTATGLDINGNADVSGNLSVGGVLTYEDVKNVDAIGIVTARAGIKMTGGSLYVGGNSNFTGTLTGTASTALSLTVADESSDTTCFPIFATASTGTIGPKTGSNLSFNSSSGQLTATSFAGSGANLTSIAANQLSSGTIPDARFPATLPAASAANLTSIPAGQLTGALPAISGSNLTGINQTVVQVKEYVCRDFETQSFSANSQMGTQLEGHITPTSSSNKIRITVCAFFMGPGQYNSSFQIKRSTNGGSSYGGLDATVQSAENLNRATGHIPSLWGRGHNWSDNVNSIATVIDSPNTTSQMYYRVFWVSSDSGTLYTNYNNNTSSTGNAFCKTVSILRLEEIDSSKVTLTNIT